MPFDRSFEDLKRAVQNPILFLYEAQRVASYPFNKLYTYSYNRRSDDGLDVMAQDWDNLIILDACRYDYFASQNWIDGDLRQVTSRGKRSWEFMQANFVDRELHDTVYVTANPHTSKLDDGTFHAIEPLLDRWDDDIGTVRPEQVVEAAVDALNTYPDKRLIIHFMQPHRPYLGPTADELRERVDLVGFDNAPDGIQIWGAAKQRDVTVSEIRQAYSESLEMVLQSVEELLERVDGKSIVTSDHGEMLGERIFPFGKRLWGHSEGFSTPKLRNVPWLVVESDQRRDITRAKPVTNTQYEDDIVQDRLQSLGYTT